LGYFYKASTSKLVASKLVSCGPKHKAKDFVLRPAALNWVAQDLLLVVSW